MDNKDLVNNFSGTMSADGQPAGTPPVATQATQAPQAPQAPQTPPTPTPTPQPAQTPPKPYDGTGSMIAPAANPNPPLELPKRERKKSNNSVFLIVALVISVIAMLVFIGLFVWMFIQYDDVSTDVDGRISAAVATAVNENSLKLEDEFAEREKEPNRTFSGPEDYGEVSFAYPKTWSVYVFADARNGGNYQAYFSPGQVEPINNDTPNALRLTISTQSFESVAKTYEAYVSSGRMTMNVITAGGGSANLYTGILSNNLSGAACLIKIRDKTVILQTDSELYMSDFRKILQSLTYNS